MTRIEVEASQPRRAEPERRHYRLKSQPVVTSKPNVHSDDYVLLDGERYFRIADSHLMPDFFMSLTGASDHWMFISSNSALTAGRRDPDQALFPYACDDQISAARAETGPTTLVRVLAPGQSNGDTTIWEPFAPHAARQHNIRRNLYKTPLGNKLVFEEINDSLKLSFRYRWTFSEKFGFIRSCRLENTGESPCSLELLDGLTNVLPYGISSEFQMRFSNLGNAYKKSELLADSRIGLFYLSSIPTDRAEPSEGLKATTVWQTGLTPDAILLSSGQLESFRQGVPLRSECDIRGQRCAFLTSQSIHFASGTAIKWHTVAEVAQDHSAVVALDDWLQRSSNTATELSADVEAGQREFLRIVSSSDGLQCGRNERRCNRHLSNTVFNVMRGGIPLENYKVDARAFRQHIENFNREACSRNRSLLHALSSNLVTHSLKQLVEASGDADLIRLTLEHLPLGFSRRHGDPTRPWNRFSINLRSSDGRTKLDYQGNWRDIFQNWEALSFSFPDLSTSMVCRFVNATTADGYNPYRLTKDGFEWEEPGLDDSWGNIGYWTDHQIIYLLKLLESNRRFVPGELTSLLNSPVFVHANVPYRIKTYDEIRQDMQSTIVFDADLAAALRERVAAIGGDGKLLHSQMDSIHHVTLAEKLLTLSLAKLSNFVPDGGIWLNTQRPEWNDANNALVGRGLSLVTVCHLYRWFSFLLDWINDVSDESFQVSVEVADFFGRINSVLKAHLGEPGGSTTPGRRRQIVDALSQAGSDYRDGLYNNGFTGKRTRLSRQAYLGFLETARRHLEWTIRNNQRSDKLFHSYNLLDWRESGVEVENLYEMLEGQVAVLSSGLLSSTEAVDILGALRASALYRKDQDSYLLYPNRQLPRFLDKNRIPQDVVKSSPLLQMLLECEDKSIIRRDIRGDVHFNGDFRNVSDIQAAMAALGPRFEIAVQCHGTDLAGLFEESFNHREFTGRSGTFFAYEGLGSIYWHMVSKLGLAVSELYFEAVRSDAPIETVESLRSHFQAIRQGIGAEKTAAEYGAFPTDPYSHTPENAGVKQPGMTGQVKEDILSRLFEVGVHIQDGCLQFRLDLFDHSELMREACEFSYQDIAGTARSINVPENGFAFTLCQVPVVYQAAHRDVIELRFSNGECHAVNGLRLDQNTSRQIFSRSGEVDSIKCLVSSLSR